MSSVSSWLRAAGTSAFAHVKPLLKSATIYVAALIMALPDIVVFLHANAGEFAAYLPKAWGDPAVRILGFLVFVARMRSLVKVPGAVVPLIAALALTPFVAGCEPVEAQAVTDTVSWTNATERVGGTPFAADEIARTVVQWGATPAGPFDGGTAEVAGAGTRLELARPGTGVGTRCYIAYHVDTGGQPGVPTAAVCKTVAAQARAPSGLTVQ